MTNLHHFSAFLAVGRRFSVNIKLHSIGSVISTLQVEADDLSEFVELVMGCRETFLAPLRILPHYRGAVKLFEELDRWVDYYDAEVFANLASLVRRINAASM